MKFVNMRNHGFDYIAFKLFWTINDFVTIFYVPILHHHKYKPVYRCLEDFWLNLISDFFMKAK